MSAGSPSLLTFLDTPVVVGDPDGGVAYVNPAFESRFRIAGGVARGQPLAALFDGGAREAVLRAVADACGKGQTVRFRLRQGSSGYLAIASPIVADAARVGVVILLVESPSTEERFLALHREIQQPLGELAGTLEQLLEQTGGRRSERYRALVEDGIRSLSRVIKWNDELNAMLSGSPRPGGSRATLDPVRVVRAAAERVAPEFKAAGVDLEVLLPGSLPAARGDPGRLELALVRLLQSRVASALESESVTVAARTAGREGSASVVISIVDSPSADQNADPTGDPSTHLVADVVREIGAEIRTTSDPFAGRTTAIRLQVC